MLIALVFFVIYRIIHFSVDQHINEELSEELEKHLNDVAIDNNDTYMIQVDQWRAREHNTITVNPVFVQFYDTNRKLIDKSPNLKQSNLNLLDSKNDEKYIESSLNGIPIRQIQTTILKNKIVYGHLVVAMSLKDFQIIYILRNILLISYPLILIVLFFIARFFAGRSIKPVVNITKISSKITKDNLTTRIDLPNNKDELYILSSTINDLLDRMEEAVQREKQFTSDASHELRTPLAVISGTLEVLIRKSREKQEYEEKINFCIKEVTRVNNLIDELLLLARFENQKKNYKSENVYLNAIILDSLSRYSEKISKQNLIIITNFTKEYYVQSDFYLLSMIISNLLSNAIKYSNPNGNIKISLSNENKQTTLIIEDNGIGIPSKDLNSIFNPFFRANNSKNPNINGTGLGLSIVKRLSDILHITIDVSSEENIGTTIKLRIP